MSNEIYDLPTPKDFGLDFSYASWPADSEVTFCNVPWNSDYRDAVRFAGGQAALNAYLDANSGPTITMRDLTNIKWGEPIDLDIPFTLAQEFNYIRVSNPAFPVTGDKARTYYYFIQTVQFIAGNTTRIYIQTDAWQTFIYTTLFGNCYVEKSHIGIANENAMNNFGRDYLTTPEGQDIGGEYQIVDLMSRNIGNAGYYPNDINKTYDIMVVSTVSLDGYSFGDVDNPVQRSAKGSILEGVMSGAEIYFFGQADFLLLMQLLSTRPFISQGIISIQAVPSLSLYEVPTVPVRIYGGGVDGAYADAKKPENPGNTLPHSKKVSHQLGANWRTTVQNKIPLRYRGLKKFLTFPYCVLELTSNTGTPLVLKPESWNDANGTVVETASYSPSGARVLFSPYRYNAVDGAGGVAPVVYPNGVFNDGGEHLDMATMITNFPQLPLVNNSYLAYMAANKNAMAFQHQSAEWSQQKALMGADLSHSNTSKGAATSRDINNIGNNASMAGTALQNETMAKHAVVGAVGSIVNGIGNGPGGVISGAGSALQSGINTAISIDANNQGMGISVGASRATNDASNMLSMDIADSNKKYANTAANGDYAQAIAGINARIQDAKLTQPTTSGQLGGDSFLLSNYKWGYDLKVKMLGGAALASLGEYFLRYGYNIGRFMQIPASLMVMTKFTYWKLSETYIVSSKCPEEYRQTLRGIMEKGVTVWANPNDIGQIDIADNQPLNGISY